MTKYDKDSRYIVLSGEINESEAADAIAAILEINVEDKDKKKSSRKPIAFHVNTYGGEVYPMWAIISSILASSTPVHTFCDGYAMSAGFQIFLAGEKRFGSKLSTFMYHQISSWAVGYLKDLKEEVTELERMQKQIDEYILERSALPQKLIKITQDKKRCLYLGAEDAKKYGIIHDYF